MRRIAFADTAKRIAAQRDDVANSGLRVRLDHCVNLGTLAATQVRCAAGVNIVSVRMRLTVAWVRSRVEPPAP